MAAVDESAVRDRFASIAETVDDSDWNEVLARAGFASKGRAFSTLRGRAALVGLGAALALAAAATGFFALRSNAASGSAPGPKRVERQLPNGTISWLFRHELRGQSLAAAHVSLGSTVGAHWQPVRFARVLTPVPRSEATIVVSLIGKRGRNICTTVFLPKGGGVGGCAIGLSLRPFNVSTASGIDIAPDGGVVLSGLASDDVARMVLFLPHDRKRAVPLKDNAFFIRVSGADYPATLVAYDNQGLVIGRSPTKPAFHGLG